MRMIRWMSGNALRDRISNKYIRSKLEIAHIEDKMRELI